MQRPLEIHLESGRAPKTRKPGILETKFQTDIGLPLLGVVTDGSSEATQELIAESCARTGGARRRPAHFGAQSQVRSEQILHATAEVVGEAIAER